MGWKHGPLPKGTWGWGGVVAEGKGKPIGFQFCSFQGDKVEIFDGSDRKKKSIIAAEDVDYYDNSIVWPIPDNEK